MTNQTPNAPVQKQQDYIREKGRLAGENLREVVANNPDIFESKNPDNVTAPHFTRAEILEMLADRNKELSQAQLKIDALERAGGEMREGVKRYLVACAPHIASCWVEHLMEIAQIEQDGCGQFKLSGTAATSMGKGEDKRL